MSRLACPSCGLTVAYGELRTCPHAYQRQVLCIRCLNRCGLCRGLDATAAEAVG